MELRFLERIQSTVNTSDPSYAPPTIAGHAKGPCAVGEAWARDRECRCPGLRTRDLDMDLGIMLLGVGVLGMGVLGVIVLSVLERARVDAARMPTQR